MHDCMDEPEDAASPAYGFAVGGLGRRYGASSAGARVGEGPSQYVLSWGSHLVSVTSE